MTLPNGLQVPGWAITAVSVAALLIGVGATGGAQAYALRAQVQHTDSVLTRHLQWADARNSELVSVGTKVGQVNAKVDALTKLKCYEARDMPNHVLREQAFDRLDFSGIDCGNLLGNKVPAQ